MTTEQEKQNTGEYILIVEDDQAYGRVFQRKLSREGYEAEWVSDGKQGLEKIKERTPDLVILDLMMPKLDGIGVLKKLQEDGSVDKIKIIVATNLSQEVDIAKAKELGANDYFVKSDVSVAEMVEKVKKLLSE